MPFAECQRQSLGKEKSGPPPPPASSLVFYLVTCVSQSCLKSLLEWSKERKERKKKSEKGRSSHSQWSQPDEGCLLGMQTELQAERERRSSLQLSHAGSGHLDSGGGAGGRGRGWGTRAKLGRSPGRILGGREHLSGVYIVICKMSFHLFFSHIQLWNYLGER